MNDAEAYGDGSIAPLINLNTDLRRSGRFTLREDTAGTH
jgi:hypothetical protein